MLKAVRFWQSWTRIFVMGVVVVGLGLTGCGGRSPDMIVPPPKVSEVAPPQVIQTLSAMLAETAPKVEILAPVADAILDQEASVQFQVEGMPVFQDAALGLGLHLNVLLDNQFYQSVYDIAEPLLLKDLAPGTHTIRAIATLPWEESFKNPTAQAQTTFHVLAKTPSTAPAPDLPVLTYHQPTGDYGAEPILLDYLLQSGIVTASGSNTTAIAPETTTWQVRATVNGESFSFGLLEPIYLKGFEPGKNWVQLELLDTAGNPIDSLFNNTVRVINYQPGGEDTLSQLMRDEVTIDEMVRMIDPDYLAAIPETTSLDPEEAIEPLEPADSTNLVPDDVEIEVTQPEHISEPVQDIDTVETDEAGEVDIGTSEESQLDVTIDENTDVLLETPDSSLDETAV